MKSMTGFGRSSNRAGPGKTSGAANGARALGLSLDVSVRSVNGRYLETRFHLPREYAGLESDFKSILAENFTRGTLDVYINRKPEQSEAPDVAVNMELARKWQKAYRGLAKELKLKGEASLEMISRVPEIFQVLESGEITDAEKKAIKGLLKQASEACDKERVREGKALEADLEKLLSKLEGLSAQMEKMKTEAKAELEKRYRDRLKEGLEKLGFDKKIDDQRIAQEIVIQLDRADIGEELSRLKEHVKVYRQLLGGSESQGKKLDFYAQELLREVNTIGSKSHIAKLTNLVVEAKTLVEKIREQVQNAE